MTSKQTRAQALYSHTRGFLRVSVGCLLAKGHAGLDIQKLLNVLSEMVLDTKPKQNVLPRL